MSPLSRTLLVWPLVVLGLGCIDDRPLPSDGGAGDGQATGDSPGATGGATGGASGNNSGGASNPGTGGRRRGTPDAAPAMDLGPPAEPGAPGGCSVTRPGATGKEKDGLIPVCCRPTAEDKALIDEVFRLLNEHRTKNGRAPLAYDDALESAIQGHCRHMAEHTFFDHDAPEAAVSSPWDRAKMCGGSASGENIAYNQPDPADVIRTWIESPGHNQNMLNADFTRVGICHAQRRWGQLFR